MNNLWEENKKIILSVAGVFIFLFAGWLASLFLKHDEIKEAEKFLQAQAEVKAQENFSALQEKEVKAPDPTKIKSDVYVYLLGEVKRPGVYKLSADARIFQALELAGGFTQKADRASINLAEKIFDGMQLEVAAIQKDNPAQKFQPQVNRVTVPSPPFKGGGPLAAGGFPQAQNNFQQSNKISEGKIDINNADQRELEKLSGVGPAIAKRIIEYRKAHGKFQSPEDLINVRGIGPVKLEKIRPQILILIR